MRLSTSPKLAVALAALLAAACQKDTITAPDASCRPTGTACGDNADCCSYGCIQGTCMRNPLEDGMCRNTDDCGFPRVCVANHCTSEVQCRVDGDTCDFSNDCCSGLCRMDSNTCAPDRAPIAEAGGSITVPRHVLHTLSNASSDPDGTTLEYTWTLRAPQGSAAALSSTTAATPSFTPDLTGDYEVTLTVSDGFLTANDVIIVTAINTAPAVTATAPGSFSRNVEFTVQGNVSDADGDPLTCTWTVSPPGGSAEVRSGPASCTGAVSLPVTCGPTPADEGGWLVSLSATDGVNTTIAERTITCTNDPPSAEAGPARAVNAGKTPSETPVVATQGSATDRNLDTAFTWSWAVVSTPAGSAVTDASLTGADTQSASFVADLLGDYVLRATVCDREASCTSDTVTLTAYPHIQDFGHEVRDAEYAAGKIHMVGADPASSTGGGRLWILDLATGTETSLALATTPGVIGVLPSGAAAVVGDGVWLRTVSLGATPIQTFEKSLTFNVADIAALDAKRVFVFPTAYGYSTAFSELDTTNGTLTSKLGYRGVAGAARLGPGSQDSNLLFTYDRYAGAIQEYAVQNSGDLAYIGTDSSPGCVDPRLWTAQNGLHVFSSCNQVYSAAAGLPPIATFDGVSTLRHVHSASTGEVALLDSAGAAIRRYNASFLPLTGTATEAIPTWAVDGTAYPTSGLFVFLAPDGSRNAIVQATVNGTQRHGLVTFP